MRKNKFTYIFRLVFVFVGLFYAQSLHSNIISKLSSTQEFQKQTIASVHALNCDQQNSTYIEVETSSENEEFESSSNQVKSNYFIRSQSKFNFDLITNQHQLFNSNRITTPILNRNVVFQVFRI